MATTARGLRPPYETFKGATCKGSYVLGTACGTCERCTWERQNIAASGDISHNFKDKVVELAPASKTIDCAGCAKPISVAKNVCFAYCADCSAKNLGRKQ